MGGTLVRSVGLVRAKARIGLKNHRLQHAPPGPTGACSRRPCDDTRRRQTAWGRSCAGNNSIGAWKTPKISAPAWLELVTTWLNNILRQLTNS